jgi:hypothetical protein
VGVGVGVGSGMRLWGHKAGPPSCVCGECQQRGRTRRC